MAGRVGISLEALHWLLWQHRSPADEVEITQAQLGDDLAVSRSRAGHALQGLVHDGRVVKVGRSTYRVSDPAGFV